MTFLAQNGPGLSAIVAAVALFWAVCQAVYAFSKQNRLARFDKYSELSKGWSADKDIQRIKRLIEEDPKGELSNLSAAEKEEYVAVFDEIALMVESRIVRKEIAFYMFGYYVIHCCDNEEFWTGMDKDSHYWSLFFRFAKEMKRIDSDIRAGREDMELWSFRF